MIHQKKIALVNDITGYGRCSIAVQLPIISALKIQACPLPTAILAVHTGFPTYYIDDYTDRMVPYIQSWKDNEVSFDGICTGFLNSVEQIGIVIDFIRDFKKEDTKVIIDPVMGDYGKLYASYTDDLCCEMRQLLSYADVITPNLTEACQLLGMPYPAKGSVSDRQLYEMAGRLADRGPSQVVITGLHDGVYLDNYIYETGRDPELVKVKKIGSDRSGTGDVFTAVLAGYIVRGSSLSEAVHAAAESVSKVMIYTEKLDLPHNCGLAFEQFLTDLQ
ncbi:MAG: pyridoxamine kinase [Megasphaera sp.]|jgi:pyridoxine kinase|nr:pyridoxamine kinase [Megasphaera sp.]